jgi:hypothetical protein
VFRLAKGVPTLAASATGKLTSHVVLKTIPTFQVATARIHPLPCQEHETPNDKLIIRWSAAVMSTTRSAESASAADGEMTFNALMLFIANTIHSTERVDYIDDGASGLPLPRTPCVSRPAKQAATATSQR